MDVVVRFDGAAWPNPGPAAYGVVVESPDGETLHSFGVDIGHTTNNVAEWRGLIGALRVARQRGARRPLVIGDSRLVIEQASGRWKVKKPHLRSLHAEAMELVKHFDEVTFRWEPRERNELADSMAELALGVDALEQERLPFFEATTP